jgi:hypothetical protein
LSNASVPELVQLLSSCTPLDDEDILADGFRQSGKLEEFATKFDPTRVGILHLATDGLLDEDKEDIEEKGEKETELEGFYVYGQSPYILLTLVMPTIFIGKGSSVEIESTKLGTLVVIFPTVWEGEVVVFNDNHKWSFDPAKMHTDASKPSIAYAAGKSGISIEVSAGHLCALIYRIVEKPNYVGISPISRETEEKFKRALSSLLADSDFLPYGGFLGFGLTHKYPEVAKKRIKGLKERLVGRDSFVRRVCKDQGLKVLLRVMYDTNAGIEPMFMMKEVADLTDWCGASIEKDVRDALKFYGGEEMDEIDDIQWVLDWTTNGEVQSSYSGHGHRPSISTEYGCVCLMVEIPSASDRAEGGQVKQDKSSNEE